jgi:hypothetical protein
MNRENLRNDDDDNVRQKYSMDDRGWGKWYVVVDVPLDYWRLLAVQSDAWEPKTCFHNSETQRYVMKRHAMTISDLWCY